MDTFFTYLGNLVTELDYSNSVLLMALLICVMAGAAVKTTAFTFAKTMGRTEHQAQRASLYGMALTFAVCAAVTFH